MSFLPEYDSFHDGSYAANNISENTQKIEEATGNTGSGWQSILDFGGSLVQNSGQLASVFSPKYREDQIALQQAAGPRPKTAAEKSKDRNLYITIAVVIIAIVILVFILKNSQKAKK